MSLISAVIFHGFCLLFFGSGCAALIYEIVWLQLLELVIGASGVSLGVLLGTLWVACVWGACFCRDSYLPGIIRSWFMLSLEFAIGVIGILVIFGIPYIADFYASLHGHGVIARALIASACLAPPAILMGATLPVVSRFVESTPEGISWMGFFYGGKYRRSGDWLSIGWIFPIEALRYADRQLCSRWQKLLVAMIALWLARLSESSHLSIEQISFPALNRHSKPCYISIALSGFSALGAEVVWTRLLSLLMEEPFILFPLYLPCF